MILWTAGAERPPEQESLIAELYENYKRLMFSTAGKYTANPADREDVVQTALERLIRLFAQPSQPRRVSAAYISFTVRSVAVDLLRKQGREAERCVSAEDARLWEVAEPGNGPDAALAFSEDAARLRRALAQLPEEDSLLLRGKYIFDQTDRELALLLGCKADSVRMKLTRARRRAMELLRDEGGDEA